MGRPRLRMAFADADALALELEQNLRHGRAFIQGVGGVEVLSDCDVVLVHPASGAELSLPAQAVMVAAEGALVGVGIELRPFGNEQLTLLERFAAGEQWGDEGETTAQAVAETDDPTLEDDGLDDDGLDDDGELASEGASDAQAPTDEAAADAPSTLDAAEDEGDSPEDGRTSSQPDAKPSVDVQRQKAPHERLRGLTPVQQNKLARTGELNERVILERLYGKGVWESLLHNPRLTPPEVARIARKGTVPRPLLEFILENNAWIQVVTVRRALLSNPRVSGEGINKLLRITPKHELKVIAKTTTYSSMVREAARKLLERP